MPFALRRLFVNRKSEDGEDRRLLPLKKQQKAFENIYLKAQEGMKIQVRPHSARAQVLILCLSRYKTHSAHRAQVLCLCLSRCKTLGI